MRRVADVCNGEDASGVESEAGEYAVYGSGGEFRRANDYLHDGESVLFGRKGTIDKPLHVTGRFWTVDTMFYTRLKPGVHGRFFYWYATTIPFTYYSTSTALPSMTQGQLLGHVMPLPDPHEQRAIADYLDRETAQIDALIGKQERLIETLRERRAAVATTLLGHRVTSGARLRSSLKEIDDRAGIDRSQLPLLSVSIAWGVRRRSETGAGPGRAEELAGYKVCHPGDIVVNRMRAFQGALGAASEAGVVSPDYAVLRAREGVSPEWLAAVMVTRPFVAEMARRVRGIGHAELGSARTPRINVPDLLDIRVEVPCAVRQDQEIAQLGNEISVVDRLIGKAGAFIALARERRVALITAAVTGQIDVRTAA